MDKNHTEITEEEFHKSSLLPFGLGIGIFLGIIIGVSIDNFFLGMSIGLVIAVVLGIGVDRKVRKRKKYNE